VKGKLCTFKVYRYQKLVFDFSNISMIFTYRLNLCDKVYFCQIFCQQMAKTIFATLVKGKLCTFKVYRYQKLVFDFSNISMILTYRLNLCDKVYFCQIFCQQMAKTIFATLDFPWKKGFFFHQPAKTCQP